MRPISIFALAIALVGCGGSISNEDKTSTAVAERIASGGLGCSKVDALAALDAIEPLLNEFSDHFSRASSTGRIALSPVIGDMQEARRNLEAADIPECADLLQSKLSSSWDYAIDGMLAFQSDESDSEVERLIDLASSGIQDAGADLAKLRIDAITE